MTNNLFFGAPIETFGKYLDQKDYLQLNQLYPESHQVLYQSFKKTIINRIESRLKNIFGDDYYIQLRKILSQEQALISGSFIIQAILDVNYEESDIDFYIINQHQDAEKETDLDHFFSKEIEIEMRKSRLYSPKHTHEPEYIHLTSRIQAVNEYKVKYQVIVLGRKHEYLSRIMPNGQRFQVIRCQPDHMSNDSRIDSLKKLIHRTFDFDVCKNIFYYDQNQNPHLSIFHSKEIITQTINLQSIQNSHKTIGRYEKYHQRGFNFFYRQEEVKDRHHLIQLILKDQGIQAINVTTPTEVNVKKSYHLESIETSSGGRTNLFERQIITESSLEFKSSNLIDLDFKNQPILIYLAKNVEFNDFFLIKKIRPSPTGFTLHLRLRRVYNYLYTHKNKENRYIETKFANHPSKKKYSTVCQEECFLDQFGYPDHIHIGPTVFIFSDRLNTVDLFRKYNSFSIYKDCD